MPDLKNTSANVENVFNGFIAKVLTDDYFPSSPAETLCARLTATLLLNSKNPIEVNKAKALILKTSTKPEDDYARLSKLSAMVTSWDALEICKTAMADSFAYCEYRLRVQIAGNQKVFHYQAKYHIEKGRCIFIGQKSPHALAAW